MGQRSDQVVWIIHGIPFSSSLLPTCISWHQHIEQAHVRNPSLTQEDNRVRVSRRTAGMRSYQARSAAETKRVSFIIGALSCLYSVRSKEGYAESFGRRRQVHYGVALEEKREHFGVIILPIRSRIGSFHPPAVTFPFQGIFISRLDHGKSDRDNVFG